MIPDTLQLNSLSFLDLSDNKILEINPQRLLKQFPKLTYINLSGNTGLDKRFIDDLREEAQKDGRGDTLEIRADNVGIDIDPGMDIKG